jgi:hypothetical protein
MSFKNKSIENKLKQLSTLGPNLFAGKFFDLLHDSAENIRDAKGSYLLPFVDKILYMTPYLGLILG